VVPDVGPDPVERLKLGYDERRSADQRDRLDTPAALPFDRARNGRLGGLDPV
jgi:hypothetical protein